MITVARTGPASAIRAKKRTNAKAVQTIPRVTTAAMALPGRDARWQLRQPERRVHKSRQGERHGHDSRAGNVGQSPAHYERSGCVTHDHHGHGRERTEVRPLDVESHQDRDSTETDSETGQADPPQMLPLAGDPYEHGAEKGHGGN